MRTVGAREDVQLRSYACDEQIGIARFQISLQSPVVASEENVREMTTHDAKDELVARVNGEKLPSAADLPRFTAVWKTVSFARDRRMRLERGDCELVQQLRRQILPRMSVQSSRTTCAVRRAWETRAATVDVSALVPATAAKLDSLVFDHLANAPGECFERERLGDHLHAGREQSRCSTAALCA